MSTIVTGSLSYATVRDRLKGQNGVHEDPRSSNRQKFGVWYGWNGVPWCAIFCSWGFHGSTGQMGGKAAGVWSLADRFKKQGRYGYTPKVGALAIFDDYKHVEFVVAVYSDYMICVGGNTSRADGTNYWGGNVAIKRRYRSQMNGFCYPKYAGTTTTTPPATTTQRLLEVDGYWGLNSTKAMQEYLNREYKTGLSVDGSFGPKTANGVLKMLGRTQDGAFSSSDIKALEVKVGTAQSGTWNRANGYDDTSKAIQKWLNAHRG
jgi:hypothetical protein